ncbi:MAG: BREX-2 system phosphatase PglZ [Acidobacteria bacterium]|nr:BREX-2 system phosphatase PglZ [Acidobacteriota bacterium]
MSSVPSFAQVRAQVESIRHRYPDARAIGIGMPALDEATPAPSVLRAGSEELSVIRCGSVLALRERFVDLPAAGPPLVVLTDLSEAELGDDLVARLAHRRLFPIDPWQLVKERFKVLHVDPRLVERHAWAARALLDAEPEDGYSPVPSGFLDAETAWRHLFEALAGIPRGARDPEALVAWALDGAPAEKLDALPEAVRTGLAVASEASVGRTARAIFECAGRLGRGTVSVGLVARVLFDPEAQGDERAAKARGKLEALLGLHDLDAELARGWIDAAEDVVRRRLARRADSGPAPPAESFGTVMAVLADADVLLQELGATDLAWRSGILRASLDQRLGDLARELVAFVDSKAHEMPAALRDAAGNVLDHALSAKESRRPLGVEMALRLAGWLAARRGGVAASRQSFGEATRAYRFAGGFVDWARTCLWDGDSSPRLGEAYAALARQADLARQQENREFGRLLAGWPGSGPHDRSLLGVEAVLDRWIAPLARVQPVLVLVIDAMSMAVFRELERDLVWRGWVELVAGEKPERPVVIAGLPTVTEVSRTSLLCGEIVSGNSSTEKDGFSGHAGLRSACAPAAPPVLFHKGDLREAGAAGVPRGVTESIADPDHRVVGVVINAVDDHLAKGEQVPVRWTARQIRPVEELLDACRSSGRVVVLVSDHGHVLERGTELRDADGAERWRPVSGAPADDEILLQGPRVVTQGRRLLAPWSERVRFGMKKNGYHGGATLQEVVLPLGVFALPETAAHVAGWREAAEEIPGWWQWRVETVPAAEPGPAALDADRQALARVQRVLAALDARGGKLTGPALAEHLGVPLFRLGGIVSALRRILNVEGYDVLSVDDASETVQLNRDLLDTQFGLASDRKQLSGAGR